MSSYKKLSLGLLESINELVIPAEGKEASLSAPATHAITDFRHAKPLEIEAHIHPRTMRRH